MFGLSNEAQFGFGCFADVVLMVLQVLSRRSSMCLVSVMKTSLVSVVFADVVLMV